MNLLSWELSGHMYNNKIFPGRRKATKSPGLIVPLRKSLVCFLTNLLCVLSFY